MLITTKRTSLLRKKRGKAAKKFYMIGTSFPKAASVGAKMVNGPLGSISLTFYDRNLQVQQK